MNGQFNSKFVISICAISILLNLPVYSQNKLSYEEQSCFSAQSKSVTDSTKIPWEVLATLSAETPVIQALQANKLLSVQLPASWFMASAVHLHAPQNSDLIIIGKGPLLKGNKAPFWIFLHTDHGLELAFSFTGQKLIVKPTYHNGYKNIEAVRLDARNSMAMGTIYSST